MAHAICDLAPFILVTDVERSIAFYEVLGFAVIDRYEPDGTLEFAGLEATPAAKIMLARVGEAPTPVDPDAPGPGFLYLYTPDLDALREQLVGAGYEPGEIRDGRARTARCASSIPTATATWWPSSSSRR